MKKRLRDSPRYMRKKRQRYAARKASEGKPSFIGRLIAAVLTTVAAGGALNPRIPEHWRLTISTVAAVLLSFMPAVHKKK